MIGDDFFFVGVVFVFEEVVGDVVGCCGVFVVVDGEGQEVVGFVIFVYVSCCQNDGVVEVYGVVVVGLFGQVVGFDGDCVVVDLDVFCECYFFFFGL